MFDEDGNATDEFIAEQERIFSLEDEEWEDHLQNTIAWLEGLTD